ncbi:hypothetical protein IJ843_05270 [bacterium]|nr:hypothetical protein [bacterium]
MDYDVSNLFGNNKFKLKDNTFTSPFQSSSNGVGNIFGASLEKAQSVEDIEKTYKGDFNSVFDKVQSVKDSYDSYDGLKTSNKELKQLEAQRPEKQAAITNAQNKIAQINSGKEESVATAKDEMDLAQSEYLQAVDQSQNPQVIEIKDEILDVENTITQTEQAISQYDTEISEVSTQISDVNVNIKSLKSEISSYESSISSLRAKKNADNESQIQSRINAILSTKGKAEAQKLAYETTLNNTLNPKKQDLEKAKQTEKENLEKLNLKKQELDQKVMATFDATVRDALTKFNTAKTNYNSVKETALNSANQELQTAQNEMSSLEDKIAAKKAEIYKQEQEEAASKASASDESSSVYSSSSGSGFGRSGSVGQVTTTDDLQRTVNQSKEELAANKQNLFDIYDGNNKTVKEKSDKADAAFNSFISKLQSENPELAQTIQTTKANLDSKEKELNSVEKQLIQLDIDTQDEQIAFDKCKLELSTLQEKKTVLDNTDTSKLSAEKKSQLDTLKQKLNAEITNKQQEYQQLANAAGVSKKEELSQQKQKLQKEYDALNSQLQQQMQDAASAYSSVNGLKASYESARSDYINLKTSEISAKKEAFTTSLAKVKEASTALSAASVKDAAKQFDFSSANCNYDLTLTGSQQNELSRISKIFEQNKDKYEKVSAATGVPAELICAIHYRESGCNFSTYLHNGDPLGKPTTHVPKGKNFSDWTTAAIDAIKSQGSYKSVTESNVDSQLEFAERYNGLGYRKRGVASPYVWSGTAKYTGGMYVADGVYNPSAQDRRVGVAAILKHLYA